MGSRRSRSRRRVVVPLLALAAALVARSCGGAGTPPAARPAYVDDSACAACHPDQSRAWRGSHHDLAMQEATGETVLGDFADAVFEDRGVTTRFFREGSGFFVEAEGPDGEPGTYPVRYVFGVEPLQQVLVEVSDDGLQCLTVAWDVERGRWFTLYPDARFPADDALHWTGRYQSWNGMCAECHSTRLDKGYDVEADRYATTWEELDVGCQACHGPGADHVAWALAGQKGQDRGLVTLLRRGAQEAQMNACAPCHSRRHRISADDWTGEPFLDSFVPALLLEGLYHADGQILDEVYVYGSFVQSRMYAEGVSCTDCHDPHSLEPLAQGNALCTQCHTASAPRDRFPTLQAKSYDTPEHHFHEPGSPGSRCVACHMPERTYMVVDPRRDHSFRAPRPDLSVRFDTPNACGDCHAEKGHAWAAAKVEEWYGKREDGPDFTASLAAARGGDARAAIDLVRDREAPEIVRATAVELLPLDVTGVAAVRAAAGDDAPLVRVAALRRLRELPPRERVATAEPRLDDLVRAVRIEAGRSLVGLAAAREALDEWIHAQRFNADMPWARLNLATMHQDEGRPDLAEKEYRAALAIDADFLPARFNLGNLLNALGRNDEAERVFRAGLARASEEGELHFSLGLLLAEMGRMEESAGALAEAARLLPDRPRVHYNAGLAWQGVGRLRDAEAALRRAYELAPLDVEILYALALFYVQGERWPEARRFTEELARLAPGAPGVAELRSNIPRDDGG